MKLGTPTLLVLSMFASFAVVLGVMILLVREPRHTPHARNATSQEARPERENPGPDTLRLESSTRSAPTYPTSRRDSVESVARVPPRIDAPLPGSRLQADLKREQEEFALLRREMERRLREQVAQRDEKLTRLARQSAQIEPAEAARILAEFDDDTVRDILKRMPPARSAAVSAVLARAGRLKGVVKP